MHVALIAMSGIRACDPDLLAMGLTLPGFLERSQTVARLPSLGLLTLAGVTLPAGLDIHYSYHEVDQLDDFDLAQAADWDLIAISSFTAQMPEAFTLCERLRPVTQAPIVMGGLVATACPEVILEHADSVITGEGEAVWAQVLADAEAGCLQASYLGGGDFDLSDAPMPRFELLAQSSRGIDHYNRLTVQTSRGCPLKCTFCAGSILLTPHYKQKPQAKVLAEIDRIRELWPQPFIEFADDNSLARRDWWHNFLPAFSRRKVKWFTETDLSIAWDQPLLEKMAASGCAEVLVGLESAVPEALAGLEQLGDWKRRKFDDYRWAVRRIQEHGIRVNGCFILGLDEHDESIFDRTLNFARELELYDVQVTLLTPFPGTPLHDQYQREGRLLPDYSWKRCTLFDVTYRPAKMAPEELRDGFRELVGKLYDESATHWRRKNFHQKYALGDVGAAET